MVIFRLGEPDCPETCSRELKKPKSPSSEYQLRYTTKAYPKYGAEHKNNEPPNMAANTIPWGHWTGYRLYTFAGWCAGLQFILKIKSFIAEIVGDPNGRQEIAGLQRHICSFSSLRYLDLRPALTARLCCNLSACEFHNLQHTNTLYYSFRSANLQSDTSPYFALDSSTSSRGCSAGKTNQNHITRLEKKIFNTGFRCLAKSEA